MFRSRRSNFPPRMTHCLPNSSDWQNCGTAACCPNRSLIWSAGSSPVNVLLRRATFGTIFRLRNTNHKDMIARELISQLIHPLRTSDTGEQALTYMHVYHLKHLPIVNNEQLLGTIAEEDITTHTLSEAIGSYDLSLSRAFVHDTAHMFEAMSVMADNKLTAIPVVDDKDNYLGLITLEDLIQYYARSFSFAEPGGIIVLELHRANYSLAEISRIVE